MTVPFPDGSGTAFFSINGQRASAISFYPGMDLWDFFKANAAPDMENISSMVEGRGLRASSGHGAEPTRRGHLVAVVVVMKPCQYCRTLGYVGGWGRM